MIFRQSNFLPEAQHVGTAHVVDFDYLVEHSRAHSMISLQCDTGERITGFDLIGRESRNKHFRSVYHGSVRDTIGRTSSSLDGSNLSAAGNHDLLSTIGGSTSGNRMTHKGIAKYANQRH